LVGESIGSLTGVIYGASTAFLSLSDDATQLVAIMSGFEASTLMGGTDAIAGLMDSLNLLDVSKVVSLSDSQRDLVTDFNNGKISVEEFAKAIENLPPEVVAEMMSELNWNKFQELKDWVKTTDTKTINIEYIEKYIPDAEKEKKTKENKAIIAATTLTGATIGTAIAPVVGTVAGGAGGFLAGLGTVAIKNLLGFDSGGVVPGQIGSPVPILAHGGETVLPTHKEDASGFGNQSIVINISGVSSPQDVQRAIDNSIIQLKTEIRRLN
jgi:hypothetical protein